MLTFAQRRLRAAIDPRLDVREQPAGAGCLTEDAGAAPGAIDLRAASDAGSGETVDD